MLLCVFTCCSFNWINIPSLSQTRKPAVLPASILFWIQKEIFWLWKMDTLWQQGGGISCVHTYNIFMLLGIFDLGEKSCCFPTYKWGSITELFHLTILHGFDSLYYLEVPSLSAVVCYCFIREQQLRMNLCHAILFIVHF